MKPLEIWQERLGVVSGWVIWPPSSAVTLRGSPLRHRSACIDDYRIITGTSGVQRSPHINCPSFTYRPQGWDNHLTLANASSMVSELVPVVLYLRHVIDPGNVLIIEEPESHLHPAMQVEFICQLAKLVKAGVRVIVTTHSEWLLEELANIVRHSELPGEDRGDTIALRPEHVGVWLFEQQQRPRGSVVREIRLEESGLYTPGYDRKGGKRRGRDSNPR